MSNSAVVGVFFLLALMIGGAGAYFLALSQTSVHEIQSFILFLIAAVFLSAAGIINAIEMKK